MTELSPFEGEEIAMQVVTEDNLNRILIENSHLGTLLEEMKMSELSLMQAQHEELAGCQMMLGDITPEIEQLKVKVESSKSSTWSLFGKKIRQSSL